MLLQTFREEGMMHQHKPINTPHDHSYAHMHSYEQVQAQT